ncbi:NAD(P)/FAD-dependent oxidoreductase [Deinococcus yavapaiensis]|uniref:Ferredoxin--NADP reductase n=1 Tax=Deinococcus yavapaiensis KR-236 TaxID=694435 RepID=A0A318SCT6_9DEIO|nr:NAD(P)/FAD-dependent oxidoreductase [Deinococcus yavapaiensis]PYE49887.1 thioredoxin reductase (NADPH) [Deinococcus yavapaiensis KR-236]
MSNPHSDVLIVGGGPVGLYAAFYVALRGLTVRIVEARPELGGQLAALYPEKFVYDAPGFPAVRAADLVEKLVKQLSRFDPAVELQSVATKLERSEGAWTVTTNVASYTASAVILSAGIGALRPRNDEVPTDVTSLAGKRVLVFGGVPQAATLALALHDAGAHVLLGHRRALFRGTPEQLAALSKLDVRAPSDLADLGAFDATFVLNGYLPDLSPLSSWNLAWTGEYVVADASGATNLPGVFVAGDLSSNGGDLKLLAAGFAQGGVAANHAVHFVRPDLNVKPGHSSDKKLPDFKR